ncbi:hypothetical protein G7054_g682 [Neopestalotiopsis clavispora]|nr:hypothetical protein G7054_g682 [Neopestalotiopsis clavispora]
MTDINSSGKVLAEQDEWVEQIDKTHQDSENGITIDAMRAKELEKKLLRKIDPRILPFLVLIYVCNYLDRNSITQARLYGLQEDTHVKGAVYNTAISIFSAGYIAMQLPSSILMTKVRPSLFLPGCMITWAIVSGCTAATNSPASLLIVRFILGLVEAPFFPGAIYYLSCWYTKKELGIRMAFLVSGILLSNAFAGLISAGILDGMTGVTKLASWRWLFILEGLMTIVIAIGAMFSLPDYPATTKWLSDEDKSIAQRRLIEDAGAEGLSEEEDSSWKKGLVLAVKDYRSWIFACLQMAVTANISYSHFFPTLIKEIGFTDNMTVLLLTSPPYVFGFLWCISLCFYADRVQKRSIPAATSISMAMVATVILIAVPYSDQWVRYAFTFPLTGGAFGVYATTYTWLSSTLGQPRVKKAAAIGIANTLANIASLFANYFWLDKYEPTFQVSWGILLAFECLALTCILTLRFSLKRSNRKFDELSARLSASDEAQLAGLNEVEQRAVVNGFRYVV